MADTNAPTAAPSARLRFHGAAGELFAIQARNLALAALTLGIYRFWAKTRIRRYLWNHTSFQGDALEYTGSGRELFLGFLIVVVFFAIVSAAHQAILFVAAASAPALAVAMNVLVFPGFVLLIGLALYRARRYRLSRTLWRGIRGVQTGSAALYGVKYLGYWVLTIVSAGWAYPWMRMRLMHQVMNNTWFGDRQFRFDGRSGTIYGRFAVIWSAGLLMLAVMGFLLAISMPLFKAIDVDRIEEIEINLPMLYSGLLILFLYMLIPIPLVSWYKAKEYGYIASSTRYEGLTFELNTAFGSFLWLVVGNYLIRTFSLGLGTPFAQMRTFRYVCDRLSIGGEADFEAIRQSSEERPGLGEGIEAALDVGGF